MGQRLTQIATRTGDDGSTGLGDGSRVAKTDARVVAMGEVDELNCTIGVLLCEDLPEEVSAALYQIQHDLFDLGGELCIPGFENIHEAQLLRVDEWLAQYNATLPKLAEFILPGGSRAAALAHVSRTVCRRAERAVIALGMEKNHGEGHLGDTEGKAQTVSGAAVRPLCRQYLNRLSDLMFVLARVLNRHAGGSDVLWKHEKKAK
jgi:cob(I)alamin adenosyltransferase